MKKTHTHFTINSLSHCDWKDRPEELTDSALGQTVMLVREADNVDPWAVRVYYQCSVAGYVARDDARWVSRAIAASGRQSMLARVTETVSEPWFMLRAELLGQGAEQPAMIDDALNREYDAWQYSGPVLPMDQREKLTQAAVEYLSFVMAGEIGWDGEAERYFALLMSQHRMDFSEEMFLFRHQLMKYLSAHDEMARQQQTLESELHALSCHEQREAVLQLIREMSQGEACRAVMRRQGAIDSGMLESELNSFPDQLTRLMERDTRLFCDRLFYVHPHREVLRRYFSALAVWLNVKAQQVEEMPLPAELATDEALIVWDRLQRAGFTDEHHQLAEGTTRQQAMYIAEAFALKLKLRTKWKLFEQLWHISNLAQEKNKFMETGKSPARSEAIDRIFET